MTKNTLKILILFYSICLLSYSQTTSNNEILTRDKIILQESIYVHSNTTFLLTGEKLYYQIYCLNSVTNSISQFSKIAYIELVGKNNNLIFKHKIRLNSGIGQGDFFIPTNVISGSYKLIAYTQWMLNDRAQNLFQEDIFIINPYQKNIVTRDTINEFQKIKNLPYATNSSQNDFIQLQTNSKSYAKRSEVILNIKNLLSDESIGHYSLSVRKIDSLNYLERATAVNHNSNFNAKNYNVIYLPELRGELISGKITAVDLQKTTVANKIIALSIFDNSIPIFKIATTNNQGIFYFNLENEYLNSEAHVQIIGHQKKDFTITFDQQSFINYDKLVFKDFSINQNLEDLILERSIYNQIENAYNSVKSDSINDLKHISTFYETKDVLEYFLDDFTRFPTVKETFIEVIDKAWIIKEKEQHEFRVRSNDNRTISPIVLIDGFLIQNHSEIVDFNARRIKKINIVRDEYIYGSHKLGGIISIETENQDFKNYISQEYTSTLKLFKSERDKKYFTPYYNKKENMLDRIPDYRSQLLWLPNLRLEKDETNISFYTSDNIGNYEISLEGFTKEGDPVSLKKIITVK